MRSVVELVRHDLKFFGVWPALCDVLLRTINRVVVFKVLKVLRISSLDPRFLELGDPYHARYLTRSEMEGLLHEPEFIIDDVFLADVLQKGDTCFGIFQGTTLVSYGWYSTLPTATIDGLMITVPRGEAYLYKAYTRPEHRGGRLLAIGTSLALKQQLAEGLSACVCCVESNNFGSLHAFGRMGAKEIGSVWLIKLGSFVLVLPSNRTVRGQVSYGKPEAAVAQVRTA